MTAWLWASLFFIDFGFAHNYQHRYKHNDKQRNDENDLTAISRPSQ
jgi:hypothetical protein